LHGALYFFRFDFSHQLAKTFTTTQNHTTMKLTIFLIALHLGLMPSTTPPLLAQETRHGHTMPMPMPMTDTTKQSGAMQMDMPGSNDSSITTNHMPTMRMNSSVLLTAPMSQEGSGTSWHPESSPMYMAMFMTGEWMLGVHGNVALRYNNQGGPRGGSVFDAPNWGMLMAQRPVGSNGQIGFRVMMSLDRLTEGGNGYPLLLASGETWQGKPLIDRQHPHDLFSELSVSYSQRFSETVSGFVYIGYPGEPALGAPAFMHRLSALNIPDAPIAHHWQDATHITFGVATLGIAILSKLQLEASVFTGREPDEERFGFDAPRFDSYSARLSYNPVRELALQTSYGSIKNPEGDGLDVRKLNASAIYTTRINERDWWSSTLIWGANDDAEVGLQNSVLLESQIAFSGNAVYTRLELVEKAQHELGVFIMPDKKELVGAYTLGYSRTVFSGSVDVNLGAQGTLYTIPETLSPLYGKSPVSFEIYLTLRPSMMLATMQTQLNDGMKHSH
jgi:hypothetical protein